MMAGRILIVDDVATNRIILKARLATAAYDISQCSTGAEALEMLRAAPPDMVLLGDTVRDIDVFALCREIRALPQVAGIPVLLISSTNDRLTRIAALEVGIDAVLQRMPEDDCLRAWVRNLMRRHSAEAEMARDNATASQLGFSEEAASGFATPGQIALIAPDVATGMLWRKALAPLMRDRINVLDPDKALLELASTAQPDAIVVAGTGATQGTALRLLSDLRCREETRRAAIVLVQQEPTHDIGIMALDLGVNDLVDTGFDAEEMALRLRRELARKARADTCRAALQDGLKMAARDPLTGLFNRRYAISELGRIIAQAQSVGDSFAVMVIDLDWFKRINDCHGHAAGDQVLTEVARRMDHCLRRGDFLARIGGEEFLAVVRGCTTAAAEHAAERLRQVVSATPVRLPDGIGAVDVTLSIGLVLGGGGHGLQEAGQLIGQADQALYAAKAEGRNQVTLHKTAA
jgi:two-component system cell cycle response regulator